jgi:transposase-like protein
LGPEELIVTRAREFAPEFKARALDDLYSDLEGPTIADVARELGIGTEACLNGSS